MSKVFSFIKKEAVLVCSWVLALVSMFFVKPNTGYLDYIDFRTLSLLFVLMMIMAGFRKIGMFEKIAHSLLALVKNSRQLDAVLVLVAFFSSMFITNDVALITFVPIAIQTLRLAKCEKHIPFVVTMQTVGANLGSILLPVGNPQNIFLFSLSDWSFGHFVSLMLPYVGVSFVAVVVSFFFVKKEKIALSVEEKSSVDKRRTAMYVILFIIALLSVAKIIPVYVPLVIILLFALVLDRKLFKYVDYSLLMTFVGFFIFVGNIGKISLFSDFVKNIIVGNEVVVSVAVSQIISNVPCALLLSGFTDNLSDILVGVNIGGLGTLIASMASLISYKYIVKQVPEMKKKYFRLFTLLNIVFLVILLSLYFFIR